MKIHTFYFSPGGTTKKTVLNIASGIEKSEIIEYNMLKMVNREKTYNFSKDDLVILGMMTATKLFGIPDEIIGRLSGNDTPFIGVVLYGNGYYGKSLIVMKEAMEKRGFRMAAAGAFIGQHSHLPHIGSNRPDKKDASIQKKFGRDIYKKIIVNKDFSFNHSLKINWPQNEGFSSILKCAYVSFKPGIGCSVPRFMNELNISDSCVKCKRCVAHCPVQAIIFEDRIKINRDKCIGCYGCANICPVKAIKFISPSMGSIIQKVSNHRSERKEPTIFI